MATLSRVGSYFQSLAYFIASLIIFLLSASMYPILCACCSSLDYSTCNDLSKIYIYKNWDLKKRKMNHYKNKISLFAILFPLTFLNAQDNNGMDVFFIIDVSGSYHKEHLTTAVKKLTGDIYDQLTSSDRPCISSTAYSWSYR